MKIERLISREKFPIANLIPIILHRSTENNNVLHSVFCGTYLENLILLIARLVNLKIIKRAYMCEHTNLLAECTSVGGDSQTALWSRLQHVFQLLRVQHANNRTHIAIRTWMRGSSRHGELLHRSANHRIRNSSHVFCSA